MNKVISGFENAIERGQTYSKNAAKQAASDFAKTVTSQVTGNTPRDQGTNEKGNASSNKMSDDQAKSFLKDLYGPSRTLPQKASGAKDPNLVQQTLGITPNNPNASKTPEEIAKIESLRRTLHADYYKTLTQRPQRQERVAEKVEREDQEERFLELEKQKKKPKPLPVTVKQGTAENVVGVSG